MALEQAKKFLSELNTSDQLKEIAKSIPVPRSAEEAARAYTAIAGKLGYDLNEEELIAAILETQQEKAAKANQAAEAAEELSDEDLKKTAGGLCGDVLDAIGDASDIKCGDILNCVGESGKKALCGVVIWS